MFVHPEKTWNERYQHVVQINHQANPIDYFNWYLQHSRKFIANAEHAMGHERLYRMNQTIENDNTQSFQVRDIAREMASHSRDAMNVAHLNTRLNFPQHYTPPNENQSPTTSHSGGVHIEEQNTIFLGNQYEANINLSLATPDTPYYPIFYCAGISTSVPNYTQEEGSDFQTLDVVNLGFEEFNEGNYGVVRQRQFQNSPFHAGRLSFSTDDMSQDQNDDEVGPSQQYDINNPRRTTRPHVPTTYGTDRHKQQNNLIKTDDNL
ncbi:hypothetical protein H5410_041766 [Solanum commersonii]|uniref:Uncharacterized protein n=1 Tax=Solanum commersonii TaxID=4109 RepID=A0A9J5XVI5_SOLCO|nr:hypothetical protein H5410_041766 [Solanum commersonii]